MISIRKYLLFYLLLAVLSISLIAGAIAWATTRHEVEELLHRNLRQVARAIAHEQETLTYLESPHLAKHEQSSIPVANFNREADYFIQIWDAGELVYHSHELKGFAKPVREGSTQRTYRNATWNSYAIFINDAIIQVSQPLDMQNDMIREMLPGMLIPLAVQVPILAFLAWLIVGRGLRPLTVISAAISKRNPHLLEPIPADQTPIEIQPLVGELNELLQRLGTALHIQRQFTADAAHELRTPLTAVQLQLDIVQRAKNDTDKREALQKLTSGVRRSIHLVQQLLTMARQEPDQTTTAKVPVDLSEMAIAAIEQFALIAGDKDIQLRSKVSGPAMIIGESEGIRILINNLLDNAIRYTPAGGRIEVGLATEAHTIILSVADSGIGIAAQERSRIFDRFYRIPGSAHFGTGLGLAIVKRVADSHDAIIDVDAGLDGKGTSFRVTFNTRAD